jgi:preprotein translocase subunit SecG
MLAGVFKKRLNNISSVKVVNSVMNRNNFLFQYALCMYLLNLKFKSEKKNKKKTQTNKKNKQKQQI